MAREVYGEEDLTWLAFREWLFNEAPSWFHRLYMTHGAEFALFIRNKPWLKRMIRTWMDTKIDPNVDLTAPRFIELWNTYRNHR
ncbi:MAG: hypothetical protein AAFN74_25365 [Myxococcota bacterium]